MTTQPDYSKIYTHAPEQHPNLILGSLQLLFWMFFHPTAFTNHLKRIHPILETDTSLITILRRESSILNNPALRKFVLQGFVILPVLLIVVERAIVILVLVALGMPLQKAISLFVDGVTYGLVGGVAFGLVGAVAFVFVVSGVVVGVA